MFGAADPLPKQSLMSIFAGIIFGVGWWLFADAGGWAQWRNDDTVVHQYSGEYVAPGILMTGAIFLLNAIPYSALSSDGGFDDPVNTRAKIALAIVVLSAMGCFFGAIWILAKNYSKSDDGNSYPGVAILLQNILIFVSGLIARFARTDPM